MLSDPESRARALEQAARDTLRQLERYVMDRDHACRVCVPESEVLVDGFLCGRHRLAEVLAALPDPKAPEEGEEAGVLEQVKAIVKEWEDAYPEDVFIPIREGEKDVSRDRVAAQMGRHMARALLKQFAALSAPERPAGGGEDRSGAHGGSENSTYGALLRLTEGHGTSEVYEMVSQAHAAIREAAQYLSRLTVHDEPDYKRWLALPSVVTALKESHDR